MLLKYNPVTLLINHIGQSKVLSNLDAHKEKLNMITQTWAMLLKSDEKKLVVIEK